MAMPNADEAQIKAALRRAGHQILLEAGDSSSKVLPITRVDDHYELRFEDEFTFDPGILASIIDTELERSKLANEYVLEVYDCLQEEVVYSYEVLFTEKDDIIACSGRLQEKGCYVIYLELKQLPPLPMQSEAVQESNTNWWWLLLVFALFLFVLFFVRVRPREESKPGVTIGGFRFQAERHSLSFDGENLELTGKESELLLALYESRNQTLKREDLLNRVWGDEGDYVGRTLDVFISKLRKKLELDPDIKIQNIRGVGYKLIC